MSAAVELIAKSGTFRRTIKVGKNQKVMTFSNELPTKVTKSELDQLADDIGAGLVIVKEGTKIDHEATDAFAVVAADLRLEQEKPLAPLPHQLEAMKRADLGKQIEANKKAEAKAEAKAK